MSATLALVGKDAREHATAACALGVATLAATLVALAQNRAAAFAMSPIEVVRLALLTFLPLVALIVGNRLVVREYLAGTRLFVEALPIGPVLPLALKWLLGFGYLAALALVALALAARAAGVADDVTADYLALLAAKSLAVVALYWSIVFCFSLCGHLRVALYLVLFGAVAFVAWWPGIDATRFAPFALLDAQLFAFERDRMPWADIGGTLALAAGFSALGFWLARVGEGSVVERLARPMTRRDLVALGVLAAAAAGLLAALAESDEPENIAFSGAAVLRSAEPAVSVFHADASERATGAELLERTAVSLGRLQAALGRTALPVVRVALATDFERHELDYSVGESVLVRADWRGHDDYDDRVLDTVILHGVLEWLSGERRVFEPYHWVLDGFSRWWAERERPVGARARETELLARAAFALERYPDLALVESWQLVADRFAYPTAEALAWSAMRHLELAHGEQAVLALARDHFGERLAGHSIAAFADRMRSPERRFREATGVPWRSFVASWREWLGGRATDPAVQGLLATVPPLAGTVTAEIDDGGVHRLLGGYRELPGERFEPAALAAGSRCAMRHAPLGPFDTEFDVGVRRDERYLDVADCRVGEAVHEVRGRYASGSRVYVAFELEEGLFHQPLRLGAERLTLR